MRLLIQIFVLSFVISGLLAFSIEFSTSEFYSTWLLVFNIALFLSSLGKRIDVVSVILLFASAQWLLGPIIAYHGYDPYFRYVMSVSSDRYFSFVLPAFAYICTASRFLPESAATALSNAIDSNHTPISRPICHIPLCESHRRHTSPCQRLRGMPGNLRNCRLPDCRPPAGWASRRACAGNKPSR